MQTVAQCRHGAVCVRRVRGAECAHRIEAHPKKIRIRVRVMKIARPLHRARALGLAQRLRAIGGRCIGRSVQSVTLIVKVPALLLVVCRVAIQRAALFVRVVETIGSKAARSVPARDGSVSVSHPDHKLRRQGAVQAHVLR